ncbi:MAG: efflux RND transporter periplasmic adaptor subunit [Verrucomicrobiota bacterium]
MEIKPASLDALRIDRSKPLPDPAGGGRWWTAILLLVLCAAGAWWFLRGGGTLVKTAVVRAEKSGSGSARTLLNASGYVTARVEATVSSKITGKVAEILVEEGMKVEKDQTVARLDASNAESGLRLALAQLESARLNLTETEHMVNYTEAEMKRYTSLESSRAVSNADVARAAVDARTQLAKLGHLRAEVIVAERQVDDWKQQVDDTVIRAPFAGVVTTKDSQPGEMISPMSAGGGFTRTGICTLVDMSSLEIEVDVGESFINRVKAAQPVEATLDAYQDWKIPGKVIAIIPTADRQKATVKVRVAFEKIDPRILPQMGVKVAFQSDEPAAATPAKPAVAVPKEAVGKDGGRDVAWVVRDGRVERRAVTVADTKGAEVILTAGLSSGESVVLNPPATLADGAAVTVENSR